MNIKKLSFALLPFLSLIVFNGCCNEPMVNKEHTVMIPNPFVYVSSTDEAAIGAGFDFDCPKALEGYSKKDISYIKDNLFQVVFTESEKKLCLRKARGHDDVSGDYNVYNKKIHNKNGSTDIILKGKDDGYYVASWLQNDYSYAVTSNSPLSEDQMNFLVQNMR